MIIIVTLVACAITACLAKRKGYNPLLWFFAAGIIGLITLAFLPFANKGDLSEEEKIKKVKLGNIIGSVFAVITLIFTVLRILDVL